MRSLRVKCSIWTMMIAFGLSLIATPAAARAAELRAGVAKVDITDLDAGPVNDRLYARALVLKSEVTTFVLVTVDAVAIGEIGHIKNDYLPNVRAAIERELKIPARNIMANASHCHGVVCSDVEQRTIEAIRRAAEELVPVTVGAATGYEDRISENRRLKLKNGREIDVRHAYSMPPDEAVAEVGPIDPEIGVLRLNREDGRTLAVIYNFACHPIQGVPSGGNTADITGFSSDVIEKNLGEGCVALFVQGCGGDINPIRYKDVDSPRDAEPLGNLLGLSTLEAVRNIDCRKGAQLKLIQRTVSLPRADLAERISALETEQDRLLRSLRGTSLNLKTFVPLFVKHKVSGDFPSYYSHRYLHEQQVGREHLRKFDSDNRRQMESYIQNIYTMEELTRLQTNLRLLRKHQARNVAAGSRTIDVEVVGVRVGEFVLVTFPGELTVRIGLGIKQRSPHDLTFVAGYTNGYIYYSPTREQLLNVGGAQEDSDCLLAPEWQEQFEREVSQILSSI